MRILVLGGGAQGSACALDLARTPVVERVVLADADIGRPRAFLEPYLGSRIELATVDATDEARVRALMGEVDGVACALPYYFNASVSRLAIAAGVHVCDLGGNTEIVDEQAALSDAAMAAGLSIVPDCGLAPGMVNVLAQGGIDAMDETHTVRILLKGDELAFQYLGRDEEKSLPKPPERKALPRNKAKADAKSKPLAKKKPAKAK
jgi:lysine 6-dehydrogenase